LATVVVKGGTDVGREIRISDAEWSVMEVLWARGVSTAADVIAASADRGWNHSTVRTMLARLVEKGALKYEVDGPRYVYRPAVTRRRCVREESRTFLDRVFKGDVGSLLLHYVSDSNIDAEDLEALRRALDEKLKEQG